MPRQDDKSSLTQFFLMLTLALYSPALGMSAGIFTGSMDKNVWLSPLFGGIIAIPVVFCIFYIRKNFKSKPFYTILQNLLGKALGSVFLVLTLLCLMLLAVLYVRFFSEQMGASMYAYAQNTLTIVLCAVCGLFLFFGLRPMARMSQLMIPIILIQLGILLLVLFGEFSLSRLAPIASAQLKDVIVCSFGGVFILSMVCTLLFLNDRTVPKKREGRSFLLFLVLLTGGMFALSMGLVGYYGNEILSFFYTPPITAISEVFSIKPLTGLSAVFVSAWILSDIMGVFLLCYIIITLLRQLFHLDDMRFLIPVFTLCLLLASLIISKDPHDISSLIVNIAVPAALCLFGLLPVALAILQKIKSKRGKGGGPVLTKTARAPVKEEEK